MHNFVLGIIDAGLESTSGGVYNLIEGMLKSSNVRSDVIIKVFGTSVDLRKYNYSHNVIINQLHTYSNLLKRCSKNIRAVPFIGPSMTSSRLFSVAELKMMSLVSDVPYTDVSWWFYPHCFAPIPNLNNLIVICHDLQHYTYPEYFSWLVRRMRYGAESSLSNAKRIICVSNFTRNELLARHPELENRTVVVYEPHGIDLTDAVIAQELNEVDESCKPPYFLYPAIDWPHKNHVLLLETASMLKRRIGLEFKIILTGHRRRGNWLKNQIENSGLSEVVLDLGPVSFTKLIALYKRARSLVFPSLFEGFGRPLVESMACGTPIIASRNTAIPEIVGNAGLLFDPHSSVEFMQAMKEMLSNGALYTTLSSAALSRSKEFSWSNWWDNLINQYLVDK